MTQNSNWHWTITEEYREKLDKLMSEIIDIKIQLLSESKNNPGSQDQRNARTWTIVKLDDAAQALGEYVASHYESETR